MDQVTKLVEPGRQFAKDSIRLVKRCTKPDRKGNNHSHRLLISNKVPFLNTYAVTSDARIYYSLFWRQIVGAVVFVDQSAYPTEYLFTE